MSRIYLDNNATTGVDPKVLEAMLSDLSTIPANPSSVHYFGQEARNHFVKARHTIASTLKVKPNELIFTSGGTESLNMFLRPTRGHVITTDVEHSAVYNTVKWLETQGCMATFLSVGHYGAAKPEQVLKAIRPDTKLIAVAAVNAETGVKTDLESIAQIAKEAHIPLVVDGVALLGKESFQIYEGISAMAFSGHKLHGPKGIGLSFIRSSFKIPALITGGDQEYGKRAGTENLAGILGLAAAVDLLNELLPAATDRMRTLRNSFEAGLKSRLGTVLINGDGPRVINTSNLSFPGVDGETLLMLLDQAGVAASHGSACASGALEPSRILLNMGYPKERARSSLRFTISRWTTQQEIDRAIDIISDLVIKLKGT